MKATKMNTVTITIVTIVTGYICVVKGIAQCGDLCVPLEQCPHFQGLIHAQDGTPEQSLKFLRKSLCGYQNSSPKVCCTRAPTILVKHSTANEDRQCYTPDGLPGKWVSLTSCPMINVMLSKEPRPTDTSKCESPESYSVCCQSEELTKDLSTMPILQSQKLTSREPSSANEPVTNEGDKCLTPDGLPGTCVHLGLCPKLSHILSKKWRSSKNIEFVRQSTCKGYKIVCCQSEDPLIDSCVRPSPLPPNRDSGCCGSMISTMNRIAGGSSTEIGQHPWLALIEYIHKHNEIDLKCGGSLISGRYVLTAGHCVALPEDFKWKPVNIRLGEYDISNEGKDCVEDDDGGQGCTDGTTTIPIEKIIVHPQFKPKETWDGHDIALIRMMWLAPYTDFIRPICLPSVDVTSLPREDITFWAAGWGKVGEQRDYSAVKREVELPYMSAEQCQPYYNPSKVVLIKGQICAGGVSGKDTCRGDSGGPLMYYHNMAMELVGVISFGQKPCGSGPGVYTNVYEYRDWIDSNIMS